MIIASNKVKNTTTSYDTVCYIVSDSYFMDSGEEYPSMGLSWGYLFPTSDSRKAKMLLCVLSMEAARSTWRHHRVEWARWFVLNRVKNLIHHGPPKERIHSGRSRSISTASLKWRRGGGSASQWWPSPSGIVLVLAALRLHAAWVPSSCAHVGTQRRKSSSIFGSCPSVYRPNATPRMQFVCHGIARGIRFDQAGRTKLEAPCSR